MAGLINEHNQFYLCDRGWGKTHPSRFNTSDCAPWTLQYKHPDREMLAFSGDDLFECLCQLRLVLEKDNMKILCNGARTDAWPSNMSRDMGGARKIYINTNGQT